MQCQHSLKNWPISHYILRAAPGRHPPLSSNFVRYHTWKHKHTHNHMYRDTWKHKHAHMYKSHENTNTLIWTKHMKTQTRSYGQKHLESQTHSHIQKETHGNTNTFTLTCTETQMSSMYTHLGVRGICFAIMFQLKLCSFKF